MIVDINALVEQRMLARWRTLLPRAPPTPPMAPVEWDTSYSDVPRGMTEEETHHDDDEEKELLLMLLVDSCTTTSVLPQTVKETWSLAVVERCTWRPCA